MDPRKKVLLTSVYRPFAVDSDDSRKINPLELFHNQVTKAQGPFSLRTNHRTAALTFIAHNITAESTILDTPTFEEFCQEITQTAYDYIGISSIIMNITKVKRMVDKIRELSPQSIVVLGSHITAFRGIEDHVKADHYVRGDGIAWFRKELGDDPDAPIKHPSIEAHYGPEAMGIPLKEMKSGWVVPGLGCPHHCDFCCTSDFFKGYIPYIQTGQELFDTCLQIEKDLGVRIFFILDENFMQNEKRVHDLLALMKTHNKSWSFSIFSSLSALKKYTVDFLIELGVNAIWIGLESKFQQYPKQKGIDAMAYIKELKKNGISVLGSTILGVPDHTYDNMLDEIDHATRFGTDLHQFMIYIPLPSTPLWNKTEKDGDLIPGIPWEDQHGQWKLTFKHKHITPDQSEKLLRFAFEEDYRILGPSLFRLITTRLNRLKQTQNHKSRLVQDRNKTEFQVFKNFPSILWAMERYFTFSNPTLKKKIYKVRMEMQDFLGDTLRKKIRTRIVGTLLLGTTLYAHVKRVTLNRPKEPITFREVVSGQPLKGTSKSENTADTIPDTAVATAE